MAKILICRFIQDDRGVGIRRPLFMKGSGREIVKDVNRCNFYYTLQNLVISAWKEPEKITV